MSKTIDGHRAERSTEEVYDSGKHSFCDRCDRQVSNGLHVFTSGYYGGFWDTMSFMGEGPVGVTLCHDCSVWLCNEIPAFAKEAKGGHGFDSNEQDRCCEYAFDYTRG